MGRYKTWWVVTYNIVENGKLWEGRETSEMGFTAEEAARNLTEMWFPSAVVTSVRPEGTSVPPTKEKAVEAPKKQKNRLF